MIDNEIYKFIDDNNLDNIENVLETLNSNFGNNESFKNNFYVIVYLLSIYYSQNKCNDKLEFFLSDIVTVNYLQDKDIFNFILSLVNFDNKLELSFNDQIDSLKLLLDASKNYLDNKRRRYKVLDNEYLSLLIDLYANYSKEMDPIIREMFFLVLYNNYSNLAINNYDNYGYQLARIYNNFINDEYFLKHDTTNLEELYNDVNKYINNNLDLIKEKVK